MPSHKLTTAHKTYVVQRLAAHDTPQEIATALQAEFGVTITPACVRYYDPTSYPGRRLSARWKHLFVETRARVVARQADLAATAGELNHLELTCGSQLAAARAAAPRPRGAITRQDDVTRSGPMERMREIIRSVEARRTGDTPNLVLQMLLMALQEANGTRPAAGPFAAP